MQKKDYVNPLFLLEKLNNNAYHNHEYIYNLTIAASWFGSSCPALNTEFKIFT